MAHKKFKFLALFLIYSCFTATSIIEAHSNKKSTSKKSGKWFVFRKRKKKKKVRNSHGIPHGHVRIEKMTEQQLTEVYTYISRLTKPDLYFMVKILTQLIRVSTNHTLCKTYRLKLADLHYQLHHLEIAAGLYEEYEKLYPGSSEAEYCLYKAVLCMFNISLDPDRNQVNTEKTLELAKDFLTKTTNQEFKKEVTLIKQECYKKLYEKEVYVLRFYLKKKKYGAVKIRLNHIENNFKNVIPNFNKKFTDLQTEIENYKKGITTHHKHGKKHSKISKKAKYLG